MPNQGKISVVVPAYNEEKNLYSSINIIHSYLTKLVEDKFEILIVENGSTDRTAEIARILDKEYVNVGGTLNALVASKDAKVKKFIYSASSSAYGNQEKLPVKENMICSPLSPYALQKYIGELYCKVFFEIYKLPTVSLRYFSVYGPRHPKEGAYLQVIAVFLGQKKEGKPLTITEDGEQTRDFTAVSDIVRANILAMQSDKVGEGEVINIGAGKNYTINELAKMFGGEITYIPPRIGDIRHNLADINKAKELLGWEPKVNLEDGVKKLLEAI